MSLASAAQVSTYPISKPRVRTSTRPTGSRSRAPTSASRGGRHPPRTRTSTRPTGSRSRAPTSASRGGRHPPLRAHVHSSHGQPFARAHFSTSSWPPCAAYAHVHLSHGQSFSRAHLSTSHPPFAAFVHVFSREFCRRRSAFNASRSPAPRSGSAEETHVRQSTSSQTLERAQISAPTASSSPNSSIFPRSRPQRRAHPAAHPAKHREVRGIRRCFFSENV